MRANACVFLSATCANFVSTGWSVITVKWLGIDALAVGASSRPQKCNVPVAVLESKTWWQVSNYVLDKSSVALTPSATCTINTPGVDTRCGVWISVILGPSPNCPDSPLPHTNNSPSTLSAAEWNSEAATERNLTWLLEIDSGWKVCLTSPRPSWPTSPVPHAQSLPPSSAD